MKGEAGTQHLLTRGRRCMSCEGGNRHMATSRKRAYLAEQPEPVALGHGDVGEDHIGRLGRYDGKTFFSTFDAGNARAFAFQDHASDLKAVGIVVYEQDAKAREPVRHGRVTILRGVIVIESGSSAVFP
jgi:hypothetical protein